MWLRANVVLAVAVVFAIVQMLASVTGGPRIGGSATVAGGPNPGLSLSVAAQEADNGDDDNSVDDDDEDNGDDDNNDDCGGDVDNAGDVGGDNNCDGDNGDSDNSASDNGDSDNGDSDNSDSDNGDSDNDASDDDDSADAVDAEADNGAVDAATPTVTPTAVAADDGDDDDDGDNAPSTQAAQTQSCAPTREGPAPVPGTEVQGLTTGRDLLLALPNNRLSVQVLATTPAGTCLVLHLVDPLAYPSAPGVRAGDFIFQLEAFDQLGAPVSPLPAEVTLNVQYSNTDVAGLDETLLTFSRLDPLDQTWKTTPNVLVDPATNWIWVSVPDTGVYVVHMP